MSAYVIRVPLVSELKQVQELRHLVLDPARHVDIDDKLSDEDFALNNIHMAAFQGAVIIGTVRLDLVQNDPRVYEIRKMAVIPSLNRSGLGSEVLKAAMLEAYSQGADGFTLDARAAAIPFFQRCGFLLTGEKIVHEDGVPNFVMRFASTV